MQPSVRPPSGRAAAMRGLAACLCLAALGAPAAVRAQDAGPPRVEIPGTELRHLNSAVTGQAYDVYVHLPGGYEASGETYPVVYVLDAQWDFSLVTALYGQQYYDGFVPALVIVGVTWGGDEPDYGARRAFDLTPTDVGTRPTGNAANFLAFLKGELVPYVEANYRVREDRTLMGSSLGGLFTLYALFNEPGLFQRYVLTSPASGWDGGVLYTYEERYAAAGAQPPARVYMAVGGLEPMVPGFEELAARLAARQYPWLELQTRVLDGIGHSGSKAEGYTRGLQAVFARPSLALDDAVLDRYVGTYKLGPDDSLTVAREAGRLVLSWPGERYVLQAETETDFYAEGTYLVVHFERDGEGKTSGFEVEHFGGKQRAARVAP